MTIEETLKNYILKEYKSIRQFCIQNDFAYSTVDSMFKRGIAGSGVSIVISVCNKLGISTDELMNGKIAKKSVKLLPEISEFEKILIQAYRRNIDMQKAINRLLQIENTESDYVSIYSAAQSDNNSEDKIEKISAARLQKLKDAPESDEDL